MATQADVRRIALELPETEETKGHFAFSVRSKGKLKGFAWVRARQIAEATGMIDDPFSVKSGLPLQLQSSCRGRIRAVLLFKIRVVRVPRFYPMQLGCGWGWERVLA